MSIPTLESIKALDGRIFAMLNPAEVAVYEFYRDRGRKFGVAVAVINAADPAMLAEARTQAHAEQIMKFANSRLTVTLSADAPALWAQQAGQ